MIIINGDTALKRKWCCMYALTYAFSYRIPSVVIIKVESPTVAGLFLYLQRMCQACIVMTKY